MVCVLSGVYFALQRVFLVGGVGKFVRISWPNNHSYFLTCLVCLGKDMYSVCGIQHSIYTY